jgi:hypothetical protein
MYYSNNAAVNLYAFFAGISLYSLNIKFVFNSI